MAELVTCKDGPQPHVRSDWCQDPVPCGPADTTNDTEGKYANLARMVGLALNADHNAAFHELMAERDNMLHAIREIAGGRIKNPQVFAEAFLHGAGRTEQPPVGSDT